MTTMKIDAIEFQRRSGSFTSSRFFRLAPKPAPWQLKDLGVHNRFWIASAKRERWQTPEIQSGRIFGKIMDSGFCTVFE
jgi:hypothetical protein